MTMLDDKLNSVTVERV